MKIRNGNIKLYQGLLILILCVAVNFGGRMLAKELQQPVWMDMVGTCTAVYYLGLPYGIITAILNNLIFSIFDSSSLIYALVSVVCAIVFDQCVKKECTDKLSSMLFSSFLIAFSSAAVSIPLNIIFYNGYSGNIWGDAMYDMLIWYGANKYLAAAADEIAVDVLDKQLCLFTCELIFLIVKKTRKRKKKKAASKAALVIIAVMISGNMLPVRNVYASEHTSDKSYNERIFNNKSGMISSEANTVSETADGTIWIGSYAGLTKYDGSNFEFIRHSGISNVTAMLCDSRNRLWIGTNDSGIARYENGKFTFFNTEKGMPSNSIRCFCEGSGGEMYVGTSDKMCIFNKNDDITIPDADLFFTTSITVSDSHVICAGNDGRINILDRSGKFEAASSDDIFFNCVSNISSGIIAASDDGTLYNVAVDGSVSRYRYVPITNIRSIIESREGRIWLCGDNGMGFIRRGNYFPKDVKDFGVSFVDLHEDYQGNIWAASTRCGVLCLSPTSFSDIFEEYGESDRVCNAVTQYKGGHCVGTDNGLVMLGINTSYKDRMLTEMLNEYRIRDVMTDSNGGLWICSYSENGLVHMTKDGIITSHNVSSDPLVTNDRIRCITELRDGTMAVGTSDGIFFVKDDKVTSNITREDGLRNSQILCLTEGSDGILYAGSDGAGIFLIKDEQIIGNYTYADGLSSNVILRMTKCSKGLIIVTSNSLNLLSDGNIKVLTEFPYYNNYDVMIDGSTAYVLSSAGIFIADIDDICENGAYACRLVNVNYGLESSITSNSWNYVAEDGSLCICCSSGIFDFRPQAETNTDQVYKYDLSKVVCDGKNIEINGDTIALPQNATIISIEGNVRNYSLSIPKVRFYDENGSESPMVPYTDIAPININHSDSTEHIIHFQVYDPSGVKLISEKVYKIHKDQQMWETTQYHIYIWFIFAELLIFVIWSIVLIIDDRRKRTTLARFNAELEEKVEEQTSVIRLQNEQNEQLLSQTVLALANAVDAKDNYTSGHSKRVAEYARLIAGRMGKSDAEQEEIFRAGLLHDVGKIRIPEGIINKPGRLDDDEFALIKLHPITGYHILKGVAAEKMFADGARFHHERYDGTGYPLGLSGDQIPEIARIIGIADAYDAMASRRSYRDIMPQQTIRAEIEKYRGTQFDPDIAAIMLELIDEDTEYRMKERDPGLKKILAVDDEKDNIANIKAALQDIEHYTVECAESGEKAVEMIRDGDYDIALIDITLPGMDGYKTLSEIRKFSKLPVVFMTVDKKAIDPKGLKKYGVTDFITKPFMASALKEILHATLSK